MSKVDISKNCICPFIRPGKQDWSGIAALAEMLKGNISITDLNIAQNQIISEGCSILAPAIQDNWTLSKLDIQNNSITKAGKAKIQQICDSKSITCLL